MKCAQGRGERTTKMGKNPGQKKTVIFRKYFKDEKKRRRNIFSIDKRHFSQRDPSRWKVVETVFTPL